MADISEVRDVLRNLRERMRVTKVVATRAVKTRSGDFFAGMSAAWDTTQDDAGGPGSDLNLLVDDAACKSSGMTLSEARISAAVLAMETSIAAWRAALIEGAITAAEFEHRVTKVRQRTMEQVSLLLDKANPPRLEKAV
jgi:hypothetical protein